MSGREGAAPRVLYLAFYFPPSRASGVYRAPATAHHLAAAGGGQTGVATPLTGSSISPSLAVLT